MWYEVHEAFQKTSIACFCVFWIQYLLCVLASVPHCAVYRETVTSSRGRWRLLIYHCILTSVTCTSLCWTGCVCRGEAGGRVQRGRGCVCVCTTLCVWFQEVGVKNAWYVRTTTTWKAARVEPKLIVLPKIKPKPALCLNFDRASDTTRPFIAISKRPLRVFRWRHRSLFDVKHPAEAEMV